MAQAASEVDERPKRRIKARGAEFAMPPTDVPGATIAVLNDTCGNLIQLNQLTGRG